ncbi:MAG: hypothetical protein JXB25_00745 [Deltaproteobacteria bacterium]|nr:hypothetical protein [Deltaproteobacteria bacterium]
MADDTDRPEPSPDQEPGGPVADQTTLATARLVTAQERRVRQAVVVIHGIGEQRPMDTLRGFADAVLEGKAGHAAKYRSKPDVMNKSFETRCLQAPADRQCRRPLTDFYEYYWAHHMENSKYTQVLGWLAGLMRRSPGTIPEPLRPAYCLSWGLALFTAAWWGWSLLAAGTGPAPFLEGLGKQQPALLIGLAVFLLQWIGSHLVLGYVADAARYLTPSPDNIEARNRIRREGVQLLQTLHASGKYSRIVVVGHSLGSVIGYDIIRQLWVDHRKPAVPYPQKQPELKAFREEMEKLAAEEVTPAKLEAFQQSQHRLWQEFRRVGIPWLITDFITLGSPLTHAQLLMADDGADLARKKNQYELPSCPPCGREDLYYGQQYRLSEAGKNVIRKIFLPHHGAPFACVRWTNLYFPYRRLIFGDLIGGPLAPIFGNGVRDISVDPATERVPDRSLACHTRYWRTDGPALETLRHTLRLDFLRGQSAKIRPGAAL